MRTITVLGGVIGGLGLLVAQATEVPEAVGWAALAVLAVTAVLLGLRLVPGAPWWLRAVVGLGSGMLAVAVHSTAELELGRDPWRMTLGIACVAVFALAGLLLLARRTRRSPGSDVDADVRVPRPREERPTHGSHNRRRGSHSR